MICKEHQLKGFSDPGVSLIAVTTHEFSELADAFVSVPNSSLFPSLLRMICFRYVQLKTSN